MTWKNSAMKGCSICFRRAISLCNLVTATAEEIDDLTITLIATGLLEITCCAAQTDANDPLPIFFSMTKLPILKPGLILPIEGLITVLSI